MKVTKFCRCDICAVVSMSKKYGIEYPCSFCLNDKAWQHTFIISNQVKL